MKVKRTCLWTVAALLIALPAAASTFVALSSQELVQNADVIVQGKVIDVQSFWDEGGRVVVTEAQIQVEDVLKGTPESIVVVRTPGGRVGSFRVEATGFPRFTTGSEVIVFLEASARGEARRVHGFQQGHYDVVERLDGVKLAVPTVDKGARLYLPNGRLMAEPQSVELGEFKRRVQAIVNLDRQVDR